MVELSTKKRQVGKTSKTSTKFSSLALAEENPEECRMGLQPVKTGEILDLGSECIKEDDKQ